MTTDTLRARPRLLDLFCGAGGASVGYHRAGFDVVGVDNRPMPRYPFEFHQADALDYVAEHGHEFDAIHASPPCQAYIKGLAEINQHLGRVCRHPKLIEPIRDLLVRSEKLYIIENGIHAPLRNPVNLCGSSFGLKVRRHRHFETNWFLMGTPCWHAHQNKAIYPCAFGKAGYRDRGRDGERPLSVVVQVYGKSKGRELWPDAMGIHWMTGNELSQAIPPAYGEFIGRQLRRIL
jgi:DNA (cytosine-5)-methyltransferase 1